MDSYRFNIKRHRAEVEGLGPADDLVYRRLTDLYYFSGGPLPNSLHELANLIDFDVEVVAGVLETFFTLTDKGWCKPEFDAEIAASRPLVKKRGRPRKVATAP